MNLPARLLSSVAIIAAVACSVRETDLSGRLCESSADCPDRSIPGPDGNYLAYACVESPTGIGRTCELVQGPIFTSGDVDAGVAYYCSGAKPVLDAYCISCHSVPPAAGAPNTFRLDVYSTDGGLPGAAEEANKIKLRAYDLRDMPPSGVLAPNTRERITLAAWANSGAPYCEDAGF